MPGWEVAVATMQKGEKCTVYLSAKYGYGGAGAKGIPGNAALEFDLHLVEWI